MNTASRNKNESGQALIMLLFFVLMGISVATAAIFTIASNSVSATNLSQGIIARQMADSGIETGLIGIVRNNGTYTGETINTLNSGTIVVTVTGTTTKIVDSVATNGGFTKKVEVSVPYSNNVLGTPTFWKEVN